MSQHYQESIRDYQRIEQAIRFVEQNYQRQPELKEIAESIGLSEYHFQRLFSRWAGISPKRFLQFITKEGAKALLERSNSLLDTAYSVGLSGTGRLHDLFIVTEAVSPGEYKSLGEGLTIQYGYHPTPFGEALIACTPRGICHLSFVETSREVVFARLRADWKAASLVEDMDTTRQYIAPIFAVTETPSAPLPLHVAGTNFQLKVWEALLRLTSGQVTTYENIAREIGQPTASRAVGSAVGKNPIAYLIPCHRVINKTGALGNYRWGSARKKALLGWEASQAGIQMEKAQTTA